MGAANTAATPPSGPRPHVESAWDVSLPEALPSGAVLQIAIDTVFNNENFKCGCLCMAYSTPAGDTWTLEKVLPILQLISTHVARVMHSCTDVFMRT